MTSIPNVLAISSAHIVNGTLNVNESIKLACEFAEQYGQLPRVTDTFEPPSNTAASQVLSVN